MTSLRDHPSFKFLIQKCFPRHFSTFSFIRKVYIGHFYNQHNWSLKLEVEECGYDDENSDNMVFMIRCYRDDDLYHVDDNMIYEQKWVVPCDYEYIMKNVDEQLKQFMKKVHQIYQCIHCGKYIHEEESFDDKCFTCGIQNIYNQENSELICCICREPVGFGYYKKCKNNHFMHTFCFIKYNTQTNKDLCPFRCGSIIE